MLIFLLSLRSCCQQAADLRGSPFFLLCQRAAHFPAHKKNFHLQLKFGLECASATPAQSLQAKFGRAVYRNKFAWYTSPLCMFKQWLTGPGHVRSELCTSPLKVLTQCSVQSVRLGRAASVSSALHAASQQSVIHCGGPVQS
eukprot:g14188.t1